MTRRFWLLVPLATLLLGGPAFAEELTLKLRDLKFHQETRTCRAKFFMESLSGDLPPGFSVTYLSEQDGEKIQRCTVTDMAYRDPEWVCEHSFLTECDGIGELVIEGAACLDNLGNPTACGPIVVAGGGMLVDKRRK